MEGLDVDQVRNVQHQFITFISHTQCKQLLHIIYTFLYLFIHLFLHLFIHFFCTQSCFRPQQTLEGCLNISFIYSNINPATGWRECFRKYLEIN